MGSDGLARALLDALPDPTAVLDHAGDILAVNRAWQMFAVDNGGRTGATGVGMNYLDAVRAVRRGRLRGRQRCRGRAARRAGRRGGVPRTRVRLPVTGGGPLVPAPHHPAGRGQDRRGGVPRQHHPAEDWPSGNWPAGPRLTRSPAWPTAACCRIRLDSALARRPELVASLQVGVLYLAVDRLPAVNDSYGHDAGDEVLLTIGHRLRSEVRAQDTVARLGGGAFAVVRTAARRGRAGRAALPGRGRARPAAPHPRAPGPGSGPGRRAHLAALGDPADRALRQAEVACGRALVAEPG